MKYFRVPSFMLVAIPKAMSSVFGNRGLVISAKTSGCKMVSRRNIEIPGPTVSTSTDLGASSAMKVRETVENPASLQSAHMVVQQDKMSCGSRDVKWSYIWRMKPASRSSMSSSRNSTVRSEAHTSELQSLM